jgi:hypothetical protein
MSKLKSLLLAALAALPFATTFPGCGFTVPGTPPLPPFKAGVPPLTTAIFCDVETTRRCSTSDDRLSGIDISHPNEQGFKLGKYSPIGLDYRPAALAACGGQPQAVVYRDAFPTGSVVCLNPSMIPATYATTNDACQEWCDAQGWIDGDGNKYRCKDIAWRSNGAQNPFPSACTEAGTQRAGFKDPRKWTPVVWTAAVGVTVSGNGLTKTAPSGWGTAGAISTQQLGSGDGGVLITASETTLKRIFGLGNGNANLSFDDIEFGLVLDSGGSLLICEAGTCQTSFIAPYATGDLLEVSVVGGKVQYKKNGALLYQSTTLPVYPLIVDSALFDKGATITSARVTF